MSGPCELCLSPATPPLWRDSASRVVLAGDPDYPGFLRVVWQAHVREMTDLAPDERVQFMAVVWAAEAALRELQAPLKINVASLGNQVPHLHWHVIPRFADDAHFPDPVWAPRRRAGVAHGLDVAALSRRLGELLGD
ncbi:MAG: HIT family protein [Gammaproteobacteria bacterium]|nr:HIT family protein [Gammaproteobacteria bacterium]